MIAAVIVAWGETAWPDLAVAFVIAGLFLHSAWSIVKDAQGELREAGARSGRLPTANSGAAWTVDSGTACAGGTPVAPTG